VRDGITQWRGEKAGKVRETLGLDGLLQTTITHWVPGAVAEPIVIMLDEREKM
jgi:hypothetical protein